MKSVFHDDKTHLKHLINSPTILKFQICCTNLKNCSTFSFCLYIQGSQQGQNGNFILASIKYISKLNQYLSCKQNRFIIMFSKTLVALPQKKTKLKVYTIPFLHLSMSLHHQNSAHLPSQVHILFGQGLHADPQLHAKLQTSHIKA